MLVCKNLAGKNGDAAAAATIRKSPRYDMENNKSSASRLPFSNSKTTSKTTGEATTKTQNKTQQKRKKQNHKHHMYIQYVVSSLLRISWWTCGLNSAKSNLVWYSVLLNQSLLGVSKNLCRSLSTSCFNNFWASEPSHLFGST